MNNDLKVV